MFHPNFIPNTVTIMKYEFKLSLQHYELINIKSNDNYCNGIIEGQCNYIDMNN